MSWVKLQIKCSRISESPAGPFLFPPIIFSSSAVAPEGNCRLDGASTLIQRVLRSTDKASMWKTNTRTSFVSFRQVYVAVVTRRYSRVAPPPSEVIRVTNNIAHLGPPKKGALPRQLMSLPPFPGHPLPGKNAVNNGADGDEDGGHVTAISWVKYYFEEIHDKAIQAHFTKGLVSVSGITFHCFLIKFNLDS